MPQSQVDVSQDKDFLAASPADQHAYLMHSDPNYASASKEDQSSYLAHVTGRTMTPPPAADTPQQPREESSVVWDRITGTYLPQALYHANQIMNPHLVSRGLTALGFKSSEAPAAQGGWSGAGKDAVRLSEQTGVGIADFVASPAGVAAIAAEIMSGGAATPILAATYAAGQAPGTVEALHEAAKNPTPENIQQGLFQTGALVGMTAFAAKVPEAKPFIDPIVEPGLVRHGSIPDTPTIIAPDPRTAEAIKPAVSVPSTPVAAGSEGMKQTGIQPELRQAPLNVEGPAAASVQDRLLSAAEQQIQLSKDKAPGSLTDTGVFQEVMGHEQAARRLMRSATAENFKRRDFDTPTEAPATSTTGIETLPPEQQAIAAHALDRVKLKETASLNVPPEVDAAISAAGLKRIGAGYKDVSLVDIEHPDFPGLSGAFNYGKDFSAEAMKSKMADRLETFIGKTEQFKEGFFPGGQTIDDTRLQAAVDKLRGVESVASSPLPSPEQIVTPSRVAGPMILPDPLKASLEAMVQMNSQLDSATTEAQSTAIQARLEELKANARTQLKQFTPRLTNEQVAALRNHVGSIADENFTQGNAIRELTEQTIKNRSLRQQIHEVKAEGGPIQGGIDAVTGEITSVKPPTTVKRFSRVLLDEFMGKSRLPGADVYDPVQKPAKIPQDKWDMFQNAARVETDKLAKEIRTELAIASDTDNMSSTYFADSGILDKLKSYDDLMGRLYKARLSEKSLPPGQAGNLPVETGPKGEIVAKEVGASWNFKRAEAVLGKTLRQIPTDEEFFREADMREDRGRIHNVIAEALDKVLKARTPKGKEKEAGFIGEAPVEERAKLLEMSRIANRPVPIDPSRLTGPALVDRAKAIGQPAWEATDERPAGNEGWLSPNGKQFIDNGNLTHQDTAAGLLPDVEKVGSAYRTLSDNGWIRKRQAGRNNNFEVSPITEKSVNAIEMDMIRNGRHGEAVTIDYPGPTGMRSLHVGEDWEDLLPAVRAEQRLISIRQRGVGGVEMLTGGTIGAAAGYAVGGPVGAGIGWFTGALAPAFARSAPMRAAFARVRPAFGDIGISMKEWLSGKEQQPPISEDMGNIIDAQRRDIQGPTISLTNRLAQLPGDIASKFDKFLFVSDRPGAMMNFLLKFDPRGEAFRNLRNKLDPRGEDSPYVSARLAAGKAFGTQGEHIQDYQDIIRKANDAGLGNHLSAYLNLKGYQRVYQVLEERMGEFDQNIQNVETKLQSPSLTPRQRIALEDDLGEFKSAKRDLTQRIASKEVTPTDYDPQKINRDLSQLATQLKPDEYGQVKQLADRVFTMNKKVLGMLHNSGIVSDADFQKYSERGPEYIPMHRIFEQVADNNARTFGKGSPLYLRQQNVIKALTGSERINRDPIIASADANYEGIKEVMRNGVIKDFINLSMKDPQGVGTYFHQVDAQYKAQPGESLVGTYVDGKPLTYAVPSWLGEVLKNAAPVHTDIVGGALARFAAQTFKAGVTGANLGFTFSRAIMDLTSMATMSKAGIKLTSLPQDAAGILKYWTRNLVDSMQKNPAAQEYRSAGAAFGAVQRQLTPEHFLNMDELGFKSRIAHGRILDYVKDFNVAVEDAIKATTFQRLRESGYTEKQAAWETLRFGGAPDYSRGGAMTAGANLTFMFLNARLQHISRVLERAREDPGQIGGALAALSLVALTLNEHNQSQKDEKGVELMRKVPVSDRERNFVVLSGNTYQSSTGATLPYYTKVPKTDIVRMLYNPIENTVNKVLGREDRSGTQIGLDTIAQFLPTESQIDEKNKAKSLALGLASSVNPALRVPVEEMANYQTGLGGRPIVPGRELNLPPEMQFGPGTSRSAIAMGRGGPSGTAAGALTGGTLGLLFGGGVGAAAGIGIGGVVGGVGGISPRRIEHVITGTGGGLGGVAESIASAAIPPTRVQSELSGPEAWRKTPVVGPLASRFMPSPVDQEMQNLTSKFYENTQRLAMANRAFETMAKNNQMQDASAYFATHKSDVLKGRMATQMQQEVGQLDNKMREIEQNPALSPEARQNVLRAIYNAKLNLLRTYNKLLETTPEKSGDTHPVGNTTRP